MVPSLKAAQEPLFINAAAWRDLFRILARVHLRYNVGAADVGDWLEKIAAESKDSSDAIDRLRLELLSQSELPEEEGRCRFGSAMTRTRGTITVADNGIGMSRAEVIEDIGTIAKSGTRDFLQLLTGDQRKDAALIGQFGVAFTPRSSWPSGWS